MVEVEPSRHGRQDHGSRHSNAAARPLGPSRVRRASGTRGAVGKTSPHHHTSSIRSNHTHESNTWPTANNAGRRRMAPHRTSGRGAGYATSCTCRRHTAILGVASTRGGEGSHACRRGAPLTRARPRGGEWSSYESASHSPPSTSSGTSSPSCTGRSGMSSHPAESGSVAPDASSVCTALICSWMILHTRCTFAVRA